MKKEYAQAVENHLRSISTVKQNVVPVPAQCGCATYAKIKNIRYVGRHNVYNMEVEGCHNFSVNGGLIVHNCIDAVRYACEDDMRNVRVV